MLRPAPRVRRAMLGLTLAACTLAHAGQAAEGPRTLTLEQALDEALARAPTMRGARASAEAAAGRREQARAPSLPQVTGTASWQRTTANVSPRPGTNTITAAPMESGRMFSFYNLGLNASQLVFDFGQSWNRWRAAAALEDAARTSVRTTEQQVVLDVRRAFFQVQAQRALLSVARETLANQERHLHQIEGFVTQGLRPEIDRVAARTAVANARVQLIQAENGIALARAQLAQVIGTTESVDVVEEPNAPVADEDAGLASLVDVAAANRPETQVLARQRRAQELTVAALRGGYGPRLAAVAGATDTGLGLDRLVWNWFFGATLTWPLLEGGLTTGQLHEANATLLQLEAQQEGLMLQVRVEVEQAHLAVRATKAAVAASQEVVESAREQLRLAEARYAQGLGSIIELSDAQLTVANAEAQVVNTQFQLASARAQLLSALGRR